MSPKKVYRVIHYGVFKPVCAYDQGPVVMSPDWEDVTCRDCLRKQPR